MSVNKCSIKRHRVADWIKKTKAGISLVVQWLRLQAPNEGGQGSVPGQGTRSHVPQLRPSAAKS